eukprot:5519604-Pyramimonas_sp.AAC.1
MNKYDADAAAATITFPRGRMPCCRWLKLFLLFLERQLHGIAYTEESEHFANIEVDWTAERAAAAAAGSDKKKGDANKPVLRVKKWSPELRLTFAGPLSFERGSRSLPVCYLKFPAEDEKDDIAVAVWINSDKVSSVTSELAAPAWMVRLLDKKATELTVNVKGQKVLREMTLPPDLT